MLNREKWAIFIRGDTTEFYHWNMMWGTTERQSWDISTIFYSGILSLVSAYPLICVFCPICSSFCLLQRGMQNQQSQPLACAKLVFCHPNQAHRCRRIDCAWMACIRSCVAYLNFRLIVKWTTWLLFPGALLASTNRVGFCRCYGGAWTYCILWGFV